MAPDNSTFDPYEYVGLIAPGTVVAVGLVLQLSHTPIVTLSKDFSLGSFGVFLICAFVLGHIVQGVGNVVESAMFWLTGGLPTNKVLNSNSELLSPIQRSRLADKVSALEGVSTSLDGLNKKAWYPIIREIYAVVAAAGRSGRVDAFNRQYGLLRGIAAALLLLTIWFLIVHWGSWQYASTSAALAVLALIRMARFAKLYARELFVQFLGT